MQCNFKRLSWVLAVAFASGAMAPISVLAQAGDRQREHDRNQSADQTNNPAYQQGLRHGRSDREENRSRNYRGQFDDTNDRAAYQAGYDHAFGNEEQDRNERDNADQDRAQSGNRDRLKGQEGKSNQEAHPGDARPGQARENSAYQNGFRDGVRDGADDRRARHTFQAQSGDPDKNDLKGYDSSSGSQREYKQTYRQGYARGYKEGYKGKANEPR
jgi:hypothetical protein